MRGKLALGVVALVSVIVFYQFSLSGDDSTQLAMSARQEELDKPMSEKDAADLEAALGAPQDSAEQ